MSRTIGKRKERIEIDTSDRTWHLGLLRGGEVDDGSDQRETTLKDVKRAVKDAKDAVRRGLIALMAVLSVALAASACDDDPSPPSSKDTGVQKDASVQKDTSVQQDTGAAVPTCAAYCAVLATACTGANAQFTDTAACNSGCTTSYKMKAGTATDTSGNTIGCRTYHVGLAASDPVPHCPHAGPSGGNICGSWCDVLCDTILANCVGADKVYDDDAACKTACAGLATTGEPNATSGNTVQCRINHAGLAGSNPTTHCPHTAVASATCQ